MIDRRIGKIRIRRGTDAQRKSVIFPEGELVYSIDKKKIYVGNDTQYGGVLISNKNFVVDVLGSPQIPEDANYGSIIHEISTKKTYVVGYDTDKTTLKLFTMFDLNGEDIKINIDSLKQRLSAVEECLKNKPPEPPKSILTWVTQPTDIFINEHQTATFNVSATYTSLVTYEWFRSDKNTIHSGTTTNNNTLVISDTQLADGVAYYCVASSTAVASITSNVATLNVNALPVLVGPSIVTHPKSQTVNALVPATFTIDAVGSAPLTYQWMIDGVNFSGATGTSFTISNPTKNVSVTCKVSNSVGDVTSNAATLTVLSLLILRTIAGGRMHTLAVGTDGTLLAWGENTLGQLGNNSTTGSKVPIKINLPSVSAIAGGFYHSLALGTDGTLSAWGRNDYGQLGNNSTTDSLVPIKINLPSVAAIAAGYLHTLALGTDGTLSAWGQNDNGQLGNNSTTTSKVPVKINLPSVAAIAAGDAHTFAVGTDGGLSAWGNNFYGQLGNNSTTNSSVPIKIDLPSVAAIACGYAHSLAVGTDGGLSAWGYNAYGQLGNNSTTDSHVPIKINLPPVASIACGHTHTLALGTDGTLSAWGRNDYGQLGNNSTTDSHVPIKINLPSVAAIACGFAHTLALGTDGGLSAWGNNDSGQLGNNSTTDSHVPIKINIP